ncbi:hypothetical protein [Niastella sp. OAS944]|uniref:hypothetical protein n=1 Tax=Niastella sp. OAS944 TaxID=2664089 RepID=UPI00349058CB|nr:hypothetical protein [Chitinophagaceae bacterium OAS944]
MRSIFIISALAGICCLTACDPFKRIPLRINNSATFVAQKDSCGISLSVEKLSGSFMMNIIVDGTPGVHIDLDSLRIIGDMPNGLRVEEPSVMGSNFKISKERKFIFTEKRTLKIDLRVIPDTANKVMLILPPGFAKCGEQALIVDTLRVRL